MTVAFSAFYRPDLVGLQHEAPKIDAPPPGEKIDPTPFNDGVEVGRFQMTIVITILFFIYGIVFGSFFNVVGLRVPKKESIVSPPSHCTTCDRNWSFLTSFRLFWSILNRGIIL